MQENGTSNEPEEHRGRQAVVPPQFTALLTPIVEQEQSSNLLFDVWLPLLWARRKTILVAGVAGFVLLLGIGFTIPTTYRATIVVMPRTESDTSGLGKSLLGGLGGLGALAGAFLGSSSNQVESVAILRSRDLAEQFIGQNGLESALLKQGVLDRVLDSLFPDSDAPASASARLTKAYRIFDRHVRDIDEDKKTGLVTVTMDWTNPALAQSWANAYVKFANETTRQRAIGESAATIEYLNREVERSMDVELRRTLYMLIQSQQQTLALAKTRPEFAFQVIDPAKLPDRHDKVRPKKALMALLGGIAGGIIASLWILVSSRRVDRRR